jgi:hypothetical protein
VNSWCGAALRFATPRIAGKITSKFASKLLTTLSACDVFIIFAYIASASLSFSATCVSIIARDEVSLYIFIYIFYIYSIYRHTHSRIARLYLVLFTRRTRSRVTLHAWNAWRHADDYSSSHHHFARDSLRRLDDIAVTISDRHNYIIIISSCVSYFHFYITCFACNSLHALHATPYMLCITFRN